jgi:hypothetical protein
VVDETSPRGIEEAHLFPERSAYETDVAQYWAAKADAHREFQMFPVVAAARTARMIRAREVLRAVQNAWIQRVNHQICWVLRTATGRADLQTPQDWWQWWDSQNGFQPKNSKYCNVQYLQNQQPYVIPTDFVVSVDPSNPSCFVAGTPVETISGPRLIESVRPGDVMLAQNVNTGELAYRPVIATTVRKASQIIRISTVQDGVLEATVGHAFWIAGEGWVQARHLQSGMCLHTLRGGVCISDVEFVAPQPSYNLVVADFHSYFVGEERALCHDNSQFEPTNCVLPGLHEN